MATLANVAEVLANVAELYRSMTDRPNAAAS
jgi:hypothetical protein